MAEMFKPLYLPGGDQQELNPTFAQTMSSAFNLENDVVNMLDYLSRPVFTPDPAFNFKETFKARKLPMDFMPILAPVQSQAEFDATLGRVQKEYQDKAVLAASGWGGTVAALSAGMLSPTMFIPFAGQARGGKAIVEMLALAAAGSTAQNAALFLNQETRTEAELYSGIAMDTLLMGMLGGAYFGLTRAGREQLASNIIMKENRVTHPVGPSDVPGRTVDAEIDLEPLILTPETRVQDVLMLTPDMRVRDLLYLTDNMRVRGTLQLTEKMRRDTTLQLTPEMRADTPLQLTEGMRVDSTAPLQLTDAMRIKNSGTLKLTADMKVEDLLLASPDMKVDDVLRLTDDMRVKGEVDDELEGMLREADEARMAASRSEGTIPNSGGETRAAGAAPSKVRNTLGAKAAPNRARQAILNALGKMSPSYRMLTQRFFPSMRDGIAKLDMSGIQQAGLDVVEPSAVGGTVIERIRGYDYHIVQFAKKLDAAYYNYVYDGAKGLDLNSPALTQLKSVFGKVPPGKMNWNQYKEAVFDGLNTGKFPPEIADAVGAFKGFFEYYTARQRQYMAEFQAKGMDVEPLFKELMSEELGEGIENYAHHIFDQSKLMNNMAEFIEDFAGKYEKQLAEAFEKARTRYGKRKAKLEFEQLVAKLDPAELNARLVDVEGDLELLEEMPEWSGFRQGRLDLNKQARDEGWSKEQLKKALKDYQEAQPDDVKQAQLERKQLMATAKVLRKYGGDAEAKTAGLQEQIAKLDEAISGMFRETMPGIQRADLSIANIQAKGDKALAPVVSGLKKLVTEMQKRQTRMAKLLTSKRMNSASRQRVADQIEKTRLKYDAMLERLSAVQGQQVALDQRLRELQLLREDAIADANQLVRSRAARIGDLEDKLESGPAKALEPEERARMADQVSHEMEELEFDFESTWRKRGDQSGSPIDTETPDFRERAIEMATMLHQKLTGGEIELSTAYRTLRQDARGAELLRVMKLPYEMKQKWLLKDVEMVTRAYDRVMAPDLELWRAFDGSVNGKSVLDEMQQETTAHQARIATSTHVKLPKGWTDKATKFKDRVAKRLAEFGEADDIYLDAKNFSDTPKEGFVEITPELRTQLAQSVADAAKYYTDDWDVAISRLRNTRGAPKDGSNMWWRAGKFTKNMNVMTMMGGVITSSVSDVARPIWQHGIRKTLGHGWLPFIRRLNETEAKGSSFRIKSKEVNRRIGLNLEPMLHSRAQGVFDLAEDTIGRTKLERAANVGAQKMGLIALYDFWTAGMKTIAGNVTHATLAEYVPAVAKAWQTGKALEGDLLEMQIYLRNLGLRDLDIHRIAKQMEQPNGVEYFSNGGVLPNIDKWDDPAAYQAYQAAVLTEVNKLIVTPGLERPNIVDENMGYSLLFQFKGFVFGANSRMAMSAMQGNDPYLMQGVAFSLAFGALSYYTYALTAGGKTLERANEGNVDEWIWEATKRSGILGALSIPSDIGARVPMISGDDTNTLFRKPSGLLGTLLGPTYTQLDRMAEVVMKSGTDDPKQKERNMKALRQVFVPFQNHFIFRQLFDRAGEAMYGS